MKDVNRFFEYDIITKSSISIKIKEMCKRVCLCRSCQINEEFQKDYEKSWCGLCALCHSLDTTTTKKCNNFIDWINIIRRIKGHNSNG